MGASKTAPSLARGRKRLNILLVPPPHGRGRTRRYVRFDARRMDSETYVKFVSFVAGIEAWTQRRVDHGRLFATALDMFMRTHRAWAIGPGEAAADWREAAD